MAIETLFDPSSGPIERLRRVLLSAVIFLVPLLTAVDITVLEGYLLWTVQFDANPAVLDVCHRDNHHCR